MWELYKAVEAGYEILGIMCAWYVPEMEMLVRVDTSLSDSLSYDPAVTLNGNIATSAEHVCEHRRHETSLRGVRSHSSSARS